MGYDVARIRAAFPALAEGAAHFDGPGGSQVPAVVADAVAATLRSAISNRGQVTASSRRADRIVTEARAAMADYLGAVPDAVVFGRSMTQLTFDVSRAFAKDWRKGDEIVVTRLDHDANIRPWVYAADSCGATVRWADFDRDSGELPLESIANQLSERTRLVAVTAASNLIGTRPDIAAIAAIVHSVGALLFIDGVHYSAHVLPDLGALGADLFVCSPYKFCGPHCGVLSGRLEVLESLHPDKLLPSSEAVPDRFELGTLPYETMAGTTAAVDFLAGLDDAATGSRRARLARSFDALARHEEGLRLHVEEGLADLGATCYSRAAGRTPTLLFDLPGRTSDEVQRGLAAAGVNAPAGSFYAVVAAGVLGLGSAGAVRVGLAPYNDESDIDRLLARLALLSSR
jgi:cysteine desulfurase family protein (TIGR01976 family)